MTRPKENPAIWGEIGGRIRHFRRSQGKTVDWLAEAVGVNRVQIVRIEAGQVGTTIERLARVAEALGVSVADLIPPPRTTDGDLLESTLRDRGLSAEEVARVAEYIELVERACQGE